MRAVICLVAVCAGAVPLVGAQDLPLSALPIELQGVVVARTPTRSGCLVRCAAPEEPRRTSILQVGQTACDLAVVLEVHEDGVVVRNVRTNGIERLAFRGGGRATSLLTRPPVPAASGPTIVNEAPDSVTVDLPKAAVGEYLANLPELLSSAVATPHFAAGDGGVPSIDGFQISQVKPGSVVEKLGIRNGDVIEAVNGQRLDSLATVIRMFGDAQVATQSTMTVLRDGQRLTFTFRTK